MYLYKALIRFHVIEESRFFLPLEKPPPTWPRQTGSPSFYSPTFRPRLDCTGIKIPLFSALFMRLERRIEQIVSCGKFPSPMHFEGKKTSSLS
jgi:hypothetical protein